MDPHSQDEGRGPGPAVEHQGRVLGGPGAGVKPGGLPSGKRAREQLRYGGRTETPCPVLRKAPRVGDKHQGEGRGRRGRRTPPSGGEVGDPALLWGR